MSKGKLRQRLKHVTTLANADADAVKSHWWTISAEERRSILRFEEPQLVERMFEIWQSLRISDMTCFVCGIHGQDVAPNAKFNDLFAMEGFVGPSGHLRDAVFYAKRSLAESAYFFDMMEECLGSPLLHGRAKLPRRHWPSLFISTPNSWQEFMSQIFRLVELAVCFAEEDARSVKQHMSASMVADAKETQSAKRRARKKRISLQVRSGARTDELDPTGCPACDGTRVLCGSVCPLCGDDSGSEDSPIAVEVNAGTHHADVALEPSACTEAEVAATSNCALADAMEVIDVPTDATSESSVVAPASTTSASSKDDVNMIHVEDEDKQCRNGCSLSVSSILPELVDHRTFKASFRNWSSGWSPAQESYCESNWQSIDLDQLTTQCFADINNPDKFELRSSGFCASVKNTFIDISLVCTAPELRRSRSLPATRM